MHTRPGVCAHHLPKELHFPKKGARRQAFPNPNTNTAARTRAHPKSWNEGAILALCKCQARKWTRAPPPNQKTSLPLLSAPWKDKPFDFVCKASLEIYACMRLWSLHLNFYKGVQVGSGKTKNNNNKKNPPVTFFTATYASMFLSWTFMWL